MPFGVYRAVGNTLDLGYPVSHVREQAFQGFDRLLLVWANNFNRRPVGKWGVDMGHERTFEAGE